MNGPVGLRSATTTTRLCSTAFLSSVRVRFFPMCDYVGRRRFRSRLTGAEAEVSVRRSLVDATYMASRVPATDPPPFDVTEGAGPIYMPVGALTNVTSSPAGYVIIGGGKTAMDAAVVVAQPRRFYPKTSPGSVLATRGF